MKEMYACYIVAKIAESGMLHRNDITAAFGCSPATATRIIREFREAFPTHLEFVPGGKYYVKGKGYNASLLVKRWVDAKEFLRMVDIVFKGGRDLQ